MTRCGSIVAFFFMLAYRADRQFISLFGTGGLNGFRFLVGVIFHRNCFTVIHNFTAISAFLVTGIPLFCAGRFGFIPGFGFVNMICFGYCFAVLDNFIAISANLITGISLFGCGRFNRTADI